MYCKCIRFRNTIIFETVKKEILESFQFLFPSLHTLPTISEASLKTSYYIHIVYKTHTSESIEYFCIFKLEMFLQQVRNTPALKFRSYPTATYFLCFTVIHE